MAEPALLYQASSADLGEALRPVVAAPGEDLDRLIHEMELDAVAVGWLTSIPGDVPVEMQCLPNSTLPAEMAKQFGYAVTEIGKTVRILPVAIIERFARRADGEMEPLVAGSTGPVAMTVTHTGIAAVIEYDLILATAVPDQRMRIAP
jgi:hypothetical protein